MRTNTECMLLGTAPARVTAEGRGGWLHCYQAHSQDDE